MTVPPDASPGPIDPSKAIERAGDSPQSGKGFGSYMQDGAQGGLKAQGPTPMNLAQGPAQTSAPPNMDTIQNQAKVAQDGLGTIGQQLKTPNMRLKRSQAHLLKNKLTDAQEHIRGASAKLGIDSPAFKPPSGGSVIGRFAAYINDGQDQLIQVQQQLKEMSANGKQLNAADMLSVTVKMNLAQQEIEYSTTLLGKVMESIKQVMNIQL